MLAWGELEAKSDYTLDSYRFGTGQFWHPVNTYNFRISIVLPSMRMAPLS